jgi:hypothetical protein
MAHTFLLALSVPPGKRALLLFLLGLIGGFAGARVNARLGRAKPSWRIHSVKRGDVHVHHVVFGIVTMIVCGALTFALASDSAWRSFLALSFGAGAGVVLDEFALILHLEDVYWSEAGRKSVDAVVLTAAATLTLLFGFMPFGTETSFVEGPRWFLVAVVALNLVAVVVASLKGKYRLAALGVFVPFAAFAAALTIARPDSPWARRRYAGNTERQLKARRRATVWQAHLRRLHDLIAGAPDKPPAG